MNVLVGGVPSRLAVGALGLALVTGCVSPSRTTGDYRHKAANTAEAMVSAIASAELSADAYLDGKAFGPYTNVNVTDAETDANDMASGFDSVQPPNAAADELRRELDSAMEDATSALADLRIAVRRGDRPAIRKALDDLAAPKSDLEKIEKIA